MYKFSVDKVLVVCQKPNEAEKLFRSRAEGGRLGLKGGVNAQICDKVRRLLTDREIIAQETFIHG